MTAHLPLTPHRTRLDPPCAVFSEVTVRKRWDSTVITRNNEIPGQATAGQLRRSSCLVSVRVFNGTGLPAPFSAVSIWYSHSLTRSTKRCHDAAFKVNSPANEYEQNAKLSLEQQTADYCLPVPDLE